MVYIVGFDAYELRLGDKMPSMTLWLILRFSILQMIGVDCYSKVYLSDYVNDYIIT